ncbi:hypothetical protein [Burkholderia cenocepacia]|uniref:hypothetical protein n=1 Tax=Burkholderia cenocepacia TaxID=95486 RepID=UPI002230FA2F|nr:hypothetical protein [Burkholderia cenocepacia]MCW3678642.1 hypothetical protein [Burkholderia cenocepacia]
MDEFTVNGAPPLEEQASYFDRDYAENMVINAMARIDQTCARSRYFGSEGWYELLAIRTDHIGAVRRWIVRRLVHVICSLSRPVPSRGENQMVGGVAHAIGRGSVGREVGSIGVPRTDRSRPATTVVSNDYFTVMEARSPRFTLYAVQLSDGGFSIANGPGTSLFDPERFDVVGWHLPIRFEWPEHAVEAIESGPDVAFDVRADSAWSIHCLRLGASPWAPYERSAADLR